MDYSSLDFDRLPDWAIYKEASLHNLSLPFGKERETLKTWLQENKPSNVSEDLAALLVAKLENIKTKYTLENLINKNLLMEVSKSIPYPNEYIALKWLYYSGNIDKPDKILLNDVNLQKWLNRPILHPRLETIAKLLSDERSYVISNGKITEDYMKALDLSKEPYIIMKYTYDEDISNYSVSEFELYVLAINLGFDFSYDPYLFVKENLPSLDWFENQLEYVRSLPRDVARYIEEYKNNRYTFINLYLRSGQTDNEIIAMHKAIMNSPRNDKPYTVHRVVSDISYIQSPNFVSKGFLSTTVNYMYAPNEISRLLFNNDDHYYLLKITIPVGTPGLFIEGKGAEFEVLFTHNIVLSVQGMGYSKYYSTKKGIFVNLPTVNLTITYVPEII